MDHNGYPTQNGGANGRNGNPALREQVPIRTRPYTVAEAIPYSPFSSIVPFNSDIIPMPHIGLRSSTSIFANEAEKGAARQTLDSLNREAASNQQTSQRLQQTLEQLQTLLRPDGLSIYKFKTAPKAISGAQAPVQSQAKLGPLSKMVYDTTNVEFRYPSPVTPGSREVEPKASSAKPKEKIKRDTHLPSPKTVQHKTINEKAAEKNTTVVVQPTYSTPPVQRVNTPKQSPPRSKSSFEIVIPSRKQSTPAPPKPPIQLSTPQPPPATINPAVLVAPQASVARTSSSDGQFAIVIDNHPPTFKPEDYEVIEEEPDAPEDITHLSKKRSRIEYEVDGVELTRGLDQREKADLAFRNLREYLLDIFEAEDQFQPDIISPSAEFFIATDDGLTLSGSVQTKVETLLQKMISVGHLSQAPLEDLLRVQRLCDGALKAAETVDVRIESSMAESDLEQWLQQLSKAELGLRAAKTTLRIMTGGREEKQLYSEDVIQSAIQVFKNVMDSCIIPVVELRSSGSSAALFKLFSSEKKAILNVLSQCRRVLSLLAILVASIELSETVMNTLEFTTSQLIFVENAHFERESVLGIAKFDVLRVVAMDVLSEIFRSSPSQRQGIFDEILTSLEKLPVTRQSARQFKLAEGGSIQLVSALIMRLIQTSASKSDDNKNRRRNTALGLADAEGEDDEPHSQARMTSPTGFSGINTETRAAQQNVTAIQELAAVVSPLLDSAKANASYVVAFIVGRAMNSTKSGDAPYRNLLDLFVEDFIKCLNYIDWPAAELLLRLFLFKMVQLAEGDKTAAPAKNMALEVLGLMGAAISELNSHVRKTAGSFENSEGDLGKYLSQLAESALERRPNIDHLVSWTGPFRASIENLEERSANDSHVRSAIGLLVAEWASTVCSGYDSISDDNSDNEKISQEYGRLAYRLRMMILDRKWLSTEYGFDSVSPSQARLAYSIALLHSQFCQSFGRVLTILLGSMASEQATVRSKSLKSVIQLLETDPTILDTEPAVTHLILRCANDPSVQVRDSALGLIGKCIGLRPALEQEMTPSILQRVNDTGASVRKRAMKLSKDIYFRNTSKDIRSSIADALLHRVTDIDESVQELARQTIEEVWMSPFYEATSSNDTSAQFKLAIADQVSLMVKTVQRPGVSIVLDKILQSILSDSSKNSGANFKVCTALVASMFDTIVDNPANNGDNGPSARDALQVLTVFAKSNAKLFTPEQIQLLQPYVANVGSGDDLTIYRSVVIIFRHVLPHLSKMHHNFLISVRKELIPAVSKMGRTILDDLVACLWIISSVLDDFQHLTRLVLSSLNGVQQIKNVNLNDASRADITRKLNKLLLITGMCGKHCDLDSQNESFRKAFPKWKGASVSTLMCDTFAPFATPSQPLEVRKAALDAIGMVCQSWPKNFSSANIYTSFLEAFGEQNKDLETIIMRSFKEFLNLEEKRSEAGNDTSVGTAGDPAAKLGVMGGSQHDGVAIAIAQRFLKHITRIALASQDDQALLATEILGSINRQGLVHPKECGPTLIALETSQNAKIAEIAFREHKSLHEKHETILEKEYIRAIHLAYTYQRDVIKNTHGATVNPFTSKLHMMVEVMKISKPKSRKKFYDSLCARIDFDPAKMNVVQELPHHLEFSQFIIENLAFFDYATVDELLSTILSMEKVVAGTGTSIAHAIETEIFQIKLPDSSQLDTNMEPQTTTVDPIRLRLLTASSMMLSSLWDARTYLRRQYGLSTNRKDPKAKSAPKDLNRTPLKNPSVTGEKFWDDISITMSALATEESMMNQCRAFVELLNIDQDFKISAEAEDEAGAGRPATPSEDEEDETPGSGKGHKRKSAGTPGGRKKRARSSSIPRPY
ncbi:sister chromatid cohesion C-terminus-domain-containing protein [Xylogone sp. PMI_703]|nr:sister chromatid cohesion C-terminus-domain-containing protein [Xylogone sp. PMI_703]